jgi:hypothetical protein
MIFSAWCERKRSQWTHCRCGARSKLLHSGDLVAPFFTMKEITMADHRLEIILAARDATRNAFQSATGQLKAFTGNIFTLRGAFASLAGTGGIGLFIKKSLDMADTVGKTADKLGLSTDALQEYRYAANLAGVQQNTLDMAMQRFTRRTAEAVQGKGELKGILEQYGIAVKDATGRTRNHEDVLNDLADVIAGTKNESERLRIAFKAFDSEGASMVNMLKNGSVAMNKTRQDARDLGIVMDSQLIRNSEKAKDELTKLTQVLKVQFMSAAVGLAPEIARISEQTTEWWKANQELIRHDITGYIENIKNALSGIKNFYDQLPEGVVGAAGAGLIGRALFGNQAGAVIALITLTSSKISQFKRDHPEIFGGDTFGQTTGKIGPRTKGWEIYAPAVPKPHPPTVINTAGADAAKKEYDALMKEVAKAQAEFQKSLVIPSGTAELMEQQLRVDAGQYIIGYDQVQQDVEKTREAFESMYSDLKFQSEGYYNYRRAQLEAQAEDYEKYTGKSVLAHQWLTEQIKALDQERLEAARKNNHFLIELSERTAEAIEENFSSFFRDAFRGELDSAADYFRAFCHSLTDSFSDMLGQMTKEMLFGGGSSGGRGFFGSLFSGFGNLFGGKSLDASAGLGADWAGTLWHKGGKVGHDVAPFRYVPESLFAGAPRLHKGLAPDEFPAILQRGEVVIPRNQAISNYANTVKNITISSPFTIENTSDKRLAARMSEEMEKTARRVLREEMR